MFLGASKAELMRIEKYHGANSVTGCLIELYGCLDKKAENTLCWEKIAKALKWLGNNTLSDEIHSKYITPSVHHATRGLMSSSHDTTMNNATKRNSGAVDGLSLSMQDDVGFDHAGIKEIGGEIQSLFEHFAFLALKVKQVFKTRSNIQLEDLQDLLEDICGLKRLTQDQATFDEVFKRLKHHCSILNFRPIMVLVDNLLSNEETLQTELIQFKEAVDSFKKSAKMVEFVSFIKKKQIVDGEYIPVKLKVREFWTHFTMKQFETIVNEILDTLYDHMSHITVGKGCICVSWIIPPNIDDEKLLPELSLEFLHIIGVLSLCIGDTVIYETAKEGCETVEAAMLQAIEMKNTRAIEVLLAVGCSLEVATFNNTNVVTNIVSIRENSHLGSQSGVEHLCILGHNEHIQAIVDTDWERADCNSCKAMKKIIANLQKENAMLWEKNKKMSMKFEAVQQNRGNCCTVQLYTIIYTVLISILIYAGTKEFHDVLQRDQGIVLDCMPFMYPSNSLFHSR